MGTVALHEKYDVALLDLDGVVYLGPKAVPGAPEALQRAKDAGMTTARWTMPHHPERSDAKPPTDA